VQKSRLQHYRGVLSERLVVASALALQAPPRSRPSARDRHVLDEIAAALGRIEEGSFGTCALCETALPERRLAMKPTLRVCAQCEGAPKR
jgi:DnaK suppressor protein